MQTEVHVCDGQLRQIPTDLDVQANRLTPVIHESAASGDLPMIESLYSTGFPLDLSHLGSDRLEGATVYKVAQNISAENLLEGSDSKSVVSEIMHAATLFSNGGVDEGGTVRDEIIDYFAQLQKDGFNHLYIIGLWAPSVFSELVMPYWAKEYWERMPEKPEYIGPSCFSVRDYVPNEYIGSWDNLEKVRQAALAAGIDIVGDIIPNTVGVDSEPAIYHPDLIEGQQIDNIPDWLNHLDPWEHVYSSVGSEGHPKITNFDNRTQRHRLDVFENEGHEVIVYERVDLSDNDEQEMRYRVYLQQNRNGGGCNTTPYVYTVLERDGELRSYKLNLGRMGDDSPDLWADTLWLNWRNPETVKWLADTAETVSRYVNLRVDMAHLKPGDFWERLIDQIGATSDVADPRAWWAEAYGDTHSLRGHLGKFYAAWAAKLLRRGDVEAIMGCVRDPETVEYMKRVLLFLANHDETADLSHLQSGAAMAILGSLPGGMLFAQGQVSGVERRFSADTTIPLEDFRVMVQQSMVSDPEHAEFMKRLTRIVSRRVFRDPSSSVREPEIEIMHDGSRLNLCNPRYRNVFRVARELGDDRVLSVVNFQESYSGEEILVNIQEAFRLPPEDKLSDFICLNLFTGEFVPAEVNLTLSSIPSKDGTFVGHDVHMYALVKRERFKSFLGCDI